jgi:hypothetical protein
MIRAGHRVRIRSGYSHADRLGTVSSVVDASQSVDVDVQLDDGTIVHTVDERLHVLPVVTLMHQNEVDASYSVLDFYSRDAAITWLQRQLDKVRANYAKP